MKKLSEVFKALSDETRLEMLGLMMRCGELCVCDFVEVLGITQSKASRHLRYLVNAGLATDRRETVWVYYRIADRPETDAGAVLSLLPPLLTERVVDAADRLSVSCVRRSGGRSCALPVGKPGKSPQSGELK